MPDTPDFLTLKRNRDGAGRKEVLIRRALMMLIAALCLAGLLNAFGQRPATSKAAVTAASLKLYAPSRVRGGLFFEARFTIDAKQNLKKATLVLDPGWLEGMTINTVEPGDDLLLDGKKVGRITSAVPGLALGYVRVEVPADAQLELGAKPGFARLR